MVPYPPSHPLGLVAFVFAQMVNTDGLCGLCLFNQVPVGIVAGVPFMIFMAHGVQGEC